MANLDTLSHAELFSEISDLAREEGISDQIEWNELCDEVIESHLNLGELNDDQDLEQIRQSLHLGWSDYQQESGPESSGAISEDPEYPRA
jgi:hypothetical protein